MSQSYESIISRGREGKGDLKVETRIELGFDSRLLILTTTKKSFAPGFSTRARCVVAGPGFETFVMGVAGGGDFSQQLAFDGGRATEKALVALHTKSMQDVDAVIERVRAYYGQSVSTQVAD